MTYDPAYYQAHKSEQNASREKWRKANLDKVRAQQAHYRKAHHAQVNAGQRARRAKSIRACQVCGREFHPRHAPQVFCSRSCSSKTRVTPIRQPSLTTEDVRVHKYVGPGVSPLPTNPLPRAIQDRVNMIVSLNNRWLEAGSDPEQLREVAAEYRMYKMPARAAQIANEVTVGD